MPYADAHIHDPDEGIIEVELCVCVVVRGSMAIKAATTANTLLHPRPPPPQLPPPPSPAARVEGRYLSAILKTQCILSFLYTIAIELTFESFCLTSRAISGATSVTSHALSCAHLSRARSPSLALLSSANSSFALRPCASSAPPSPTTTATSLPTPPPPPPPPATVAAAVAGTVEG